VLGAIGAATAPAATLMVVKQYNAKGPLVDTLLPVVAMDDAVCIMIFGVSSAIAKVLIEGLESVSLATLILTPIFEIIGALALGFFMGFVLAWLSKKVKGEDELLAVIIAFIFLTTGLSIQFNFSSLLSCMMIGTTLANVVPNNKKVFTVIEHFTPPVLVLFFTISGVELNLSILKSVGLVGIAYVILRAVGKILGGYLGAAAAKSPKTVRNYLGFALLPQAGVAIGLSMVAQKILPAPFGDEIRTIILAAVIVYELMGPPLAKFALVKAGEIQNE
jgi:Kef-type K+ transport system membrane component KefB